jgi:hypothetical protein
MFSGPKMSRIAALFCVAALAGCATAPDTRVQSAPGVDLHEYKTFAFYERAAPGQTTYATIMGKRIRQATREQMQRLGYQYDESSPDLRVNIAVQVRNRQELRSTPQAGAYPFRALRPASVESVEYREGFLAIDLVDTRRNAAVWRGVAHDRLSQKQIDDAGATIDTVVRELFARFPKEGGANS